MKNTLKFLCLFLAMAAMVSCSKDDDNGETPSSNTSLVGTWKATEAIADAKLPLNGELHLVDGEAPDIKNDNVVYTFKDDGTYSLSQDDIDFIFTFETGQKGTITVANFSNLTGTFKKNGDNVEMIISPIDHLNMEIGQLDETTLKLSYPYSYNSTSGQHFVLNLTITFKRM